MIVIPVIPPPSIVVSLDESIRHHLQSARDGFFEGVLISAVLVAIGVVLEGPEILHEMWPKLFRYFTFSSEHRAWKFERVLKRIGLIGWLLVVFGVLGEGVFEGLQSSAEGQLQTFENTLLADAITKAGDAGDSARDAEVSTRGVQNEADLLKNEVALSRKETLRAENDLDAALERTKRLEQELSWRTVTPQQAAIIGDSLRQSFLGKLRPLAGITITVSKVLDDPEGEEFAEEISKVLVGLGATIGDGGSGMYPKAPQGLFIAVASPVNKEAVALQRALKRAGIEAVGEINPDAKGVVILVGIKPRPIPIPNP